VKETRTIKQTELIPAKPIEVYEAFVIAKKHTEFTGSKATSSAKVGGKFTAWDGYISGKYLKLEKPKKIVQEWKTTEWPSSYPPSKLEFTLKEVAGGTELKMVHSNVPAEQADSYRQGWIDSYWKPMKQYFKNKNA
jgi:activator of HSP90 ATPase